MWYGNFENLEEISMRNPFRLPAGKPGYRAIGSLLLAAAVSLPTVALAQSGGAMKDPAREGYYQAFKGKRVVFAPVFMGLDLTEGWSKMMKQQADLLGYSFEVRDANFNTPNQVQILTDLIGANPKPDVIAVQNPDVTSLAKLVQRAEKEGIYVIQVNMKSLVTTTGFSGGDATEIGERQARWVVNRCGKGTSQKVLILNGPSTAPWTVYMQEGYDNVLKANPDIKVVSRQSTGNYESAKAKEITQVVLQQHPDLCAIMGVWDNTDGGTAAAIKDAGKTGKVLVTTSGGGGVLACEGLKSGQWDHYVSYDVPGQGRDINNLIAQALQMKANGQKPGTTKTLLYTRLIEITRDNLDRNPCWSVDTVQY